MKKSLYIVVFLGFYCLTMMNAQQSKTGNQTDNKWNDLFAKDLSNADYPAGIWTFTDGILTATEDQCIWTKKDYQNFEIDLEFKTAEGTNSGVIVYCTDLKNWIPNSVEIQIADDFAKEWAESPKTFAQLATHGRIGLQGKHAGKPIYFRNIRVREL